MTATQNTKTRTSAGTYLRNRREEKGLSIEEVSARLYLKADTIEALERDEYDHLPTGAYIHGYLQNYAKLLGAPVDQVLAMYKEKDISEQPEPTPEIPSEPKRGQQSEWPYTILYIVIFTAILLPFTWWRSQHTLTPVPSAEGDTRQVRDIHTANSGLEYPVTIVEHPDEPFYRAPNTESLTQGSGTRAENPDKEIEPGAATYDENTITAGIGPDIVRVVITEECWIEIFDADNKKVFYDLGRPGQRLVLNGTAPFSVLLGNAAAANVEFNHLPFDTTPYWSRIGMARFVLGEDQ